jgi:hypothetical protein
MVRIEIHQMKYFRAFYVLRYRKRPMLNNLIMLDQENLSR